MSAKIRYRLEEQKQMQSKELHIFFEAEQDSWQGQWTLPSVMLRAAFLVERLQAMVLAILSRSGAATRFR
ncbi:hypothetical protein [Thioclava sp. GXIMD4215]|uniref:hypothetical protein n=1 Tax=Thioclava sp. GXIMD4215 TaxID=3131928 RepID=UPI0032465351